MYILGTKNKYTISELHSNLNRSNTSSREEDIEEVNSKRVMRFNEEAKRIKEQKEKDKEKKSGVEESQNVDSWVP